MAMGAKEIDAAFKLRERDLRARRLADSAVAAAMHELAEVEPDEGDYRRYAHEVARLATTILVSGIYINDAEIAALREERDRYKQLAEEGLRFLPPTLKVSA